MSKQRFFASDNCSGVHPQIMQAIANTNEHYAFGYGEDEITAQALSCFKQHFGEEAEAFITLTGTGSNILALESLLHPWEGVICNEFAHINEHECGALQKITGSRLIVIPEHNGKIRIDDIKPLLFTKDDEHVVLPKVIYITQSTELGTVYTHDEIKALVEFAHANDMYVHLDGARLCNAAASLGCSLKALTTDLNIDTVSFGGSKNGMMCGESVIVFNKQLKQKLRYIRKQDMQLISKMRYLSAQFIEFFNNDLWLSNATQANNMAAYLAEQLKTFDFAQILYPVDANMIFVKMPKALLQELLKHTLFYLVDAEEETSRFVTSFDTTKEDVDTLINLIKQFS
tara:strand:+ start:39 stop:1067 length:1029 start_codon:yes stop_codon:yes gene_type:complete